MVHTEMIKVGNGFNKILKWAVAFGILGLVCYPIIIKPLMDPSEYKELQKIGRKDIKQEEIQPGNMRVWRDPFKN